MVTFRKTLSVAFVWLLSAVTAGLAAPPEPSSVEFFEKSIRPILVENCYSCHSAAAKKKKGGLHLDTRDGLREGGESGPAITPGDVEASRLIRAVRYSDRHLRMPPTGKLSADSITALEKWVAIGAPDPRDRASKTVSPSNPVRDAAATHWSFKPIRQHPIPTVVDGNWPHTDVDRFLLAKMEAHGLIPARDADRRTLLRRVTFDLIGLPPTPDEISAFVNDQSPDALAKVVDRLLASPHFGERWGRHWLDVARYAESSGGGRSLLFPNAWRYRDYVIESFQKDKPYDQFLMEQLAGDLMPYDSADQRRDRLTATGFLLLGPTNYERQDKQILEMDVIDEQLDTIGRAVLGMTIGCARCHDHKFDPIPTRDYYALAGILKSTKVMIHDNVSKWVERPIPLPPDQEETIKKHEDRVVALKSKIAQIRGTLAKNVSRSGKSIIAVKDLPGIVLDDTQAKKVGDWTLSKFSGNYIGDGYSHDANSGKGSKTLTFEPDFPSSGRYEVRLAYTEGSNRADKVPVHILAADGEHDRVVNMRNVPPIDGHFVSLGTFRFEKGNQWHIIISNEGTDGHVTVDALQLIAEAADAGTRDGGEKATTPNQQLAALESELKKLNEQGRFRPMVMAVTESDAIGDCYVCIRGNFHNRGPVVPRGFLTAIATAERAKTVPASVSGRRELAAWITRPDHPLTARVMVNRVWMHLFGNGIVRSVDNFGRAGELPSHSELLDHLALTFVKDGWSVKNLIRRLVLSHAYQMASDRPAPDSRAFAIDPDNRLLTRMPRRRLEAEAIRDAILMVSGRLDRSIGGANIKPGTNTETGYVFDDNRRSIYAPVFRNRLLELLEVFDFADPNLVVGQRNVSTVATQALFMVNSPFILEQSRFAAKRFMALETNDDRRLERMYLESCGRAPSDAEREIAMRFLRNSKDQAESWERIAQAVFASIDFRYVR